MHTANPRQTSNVLATAALVAGLTAAGLTPPTAVAGQIVVEGQALNDLGGGVVDAEVSIEATAGEGKSGKVLATGQTNKTGDFKLTLPEGVAGEVVVKISAEGFAAFSETVDLAEDDEPYVVAELAGALRLTGRVTQNRTNAPIAGVDVSYITSWGQRTTKTTKDGRYTIDGLEAGKGRLEVVADGFARERIEVDLEQTQNVDVLLRPELDVMVTIVDDRGKPVGNVTVDAYSEKPRRSYSAITDEFGRAPLQGVHPDAVELRARLLSDVHITPVAWDRQIALPDNEDKIAAKLVLPRPAVLRGVVVRARDGKPVPLARVTIGPSKGAFVSSTNANATGEFRVVGLPAQKTVVTAYHPDYGPELKEIALKPEATNRVKLMLPPGAVLTGTVKDGAGKPIVKADVLVTGWRHRDTLRLQAQTDEKGHFVIEHVPTDGVKLAVVAKDFERLTTETLQPGRKPHELTLESSGRPGAAAGRCGNVGQLASLKAKTLDGELLASQGLAGKFVFLHFWATWCPTCLVEMPNVKAAAKALAERKDVVIIGVNLDEDEQALRKFIKDRGITWPQLFGEAGQVSKLAQTFGVRLIPATFLISPSGQPVAQDLHGKGLAEEIKAHLKVPSTTNPKANRPNF